MSPSGAFNFLNYLNEKIARERKSLIVHRLCSKRAARFVLDLGKLLSRRIQHAYYLPDDLHFITIELFAQVP
jgi:hypothetical protein